MEKGKSLKKLSKFFVSSLTVKTNTGASYHSWSYFNLCSIETLHRTKLIDDFPLWQDQSLIDFTVDTHMLQLEDRYSW